MRTVVLVDGEHYPPVTRWAIATAIERGHDVVGALFVGGIEKIEPGSLPELGVPTLAAGDDRAAGLRDAIDAWSPELVLDLSDEPVLGYRERMALAAVALTLGVPYAGADFRLDPPVGGAAAAGAHPRRHRNRQAHRQDRDQWRGGAARRPPWARSRGGGHGQGRPS